MPAPRRPGDDDPLREREVAAAEASAAAEHAAARAQREAAASQLKSTRIQILSTVLALLVALVAATQGALGLYEASRSTDSQAASSDRQNRETRLATAMEALASSDPSARVGGLLLLQRNIEERLALAEAPGSSVGDREDAVILYGDAIDLVENYLKSRTAPAPQGLGAGTPVVAPDVTYVVNRLGALLALGPREETVRASTPLPPTNIDLATATLYRSGWLGVSFAALPSSHAYFARIDLRGAVFNGSDWTGVVLARASLQCSLVPRNDSGRGPSHISFRGADLRRADLRGADLSGADLRGSRLDDADLRGANLAGTIMTGATGNAHFDDSYGSPVDGPANLGPGKPGNFTLENCLDSPAGQGQPTSTAPITGWVRPPGAPAPPQSPPPAPPRR